MANLPARRTEVPTRADKVRKLLAKGYTAKDIADRLAPDDPSRHRSIKAQVFRLITTDADTQLALGQITKGALIDSLPAGAEAMGRRASKGNVPAFKAVAEMSGFHNPRMDHHHSGKIEIELKGVPRPEPTVDHTEITDAEVVEE